MRSKMLFGIIIIIMLCRCTSTHYIGYDGFVPGAGNQPVQGKAGKVILKNGEELEVSEINVNQDSLSWINKLTGIQQCIAGNEIHAICINNHGRGALHGLGYGILGGVIAGVIIASTSDDWEADYETSMDGILKDTMRTYNQLAFVFGASTAGGLLGLGSGAVVGKNEQYLFSENQDSLLHYVSHNSGNKDL